MGNFLLTMVGLFMIGLFMASLATWCLLPYLWSKGIKRWVLREDYPPNTWGFIDILVAMIVFVAVQIFVSAVGIGMGIASLEDLAWHPPQSQHQFPLAVVGTAWEQDGPASVEPPTQSRNTPESAVDESAVDESAVDESAVDESAVDESAVDESAVDESAVDESEANPSEVEDPARMARRMMLTTFVLSGNLLVVALVTVWISLRTQVSPARVGWSLRNPAKDVLLAIGALVLFAPIVYLTMGVVSKLFQQEYEHPILEMIRTNPWMIGFAFWMAVIVAPITEEFAFRVLLQGFLESMALGKFQLREFLLGRQAPSLAPGLAGTTATVPGEVNSFSELSLEATNPRSEDWSEAYKSDVNALSAERVSGEAETIAATQSSIFPLKDVRAWWPILITGVLFGLIHFDYGLSWIPLSLLGIVLGWLYHLTHRIWPCILLHMGFNCISIMAMIASVLSRES